MVKRNSYREGNRQVRKKQLRGEGGEGEGEGEGEKRSWSVI